MIIVLVFVTLPLYAEGMIELALCEDVYEDYKKFLAKRDPLSIEDFSGEHSRRDVVEVVLFLQAMHLAGYKKNADFIIAPNYLRMLKMIEGGRVAASTNSVWLTDVETKKDKFYITQPVIEDGQFEAGLYTSENNEEALSVSNIDELRNMSVVSDDSWTPDWNTLKALQIDKLYSVKGWEFMVRMVASKRIDFLLAPFQASEDLSLEVEGHRFLPVMDIKIGLKGTRHFIVSTKYGDAENLYAALVEGLKALKEKGVIDKAYRESGFYNQKVKDWKKLN